MVLQVPSRGVWGYVADIIFFSYMYGFHDKASWGYFVYHGELQAYGRSLWDAGPNTPDNLTFTDPFSWGQYSLGRTGLTCDLLLFS